MFRRVARAWGLERTGVRIVERLRAVTPPAMLRTTEGQRAFLWPAGTDPGRWDAFRTCGDSEASRRHVGEVCDAEIAALVVHVLELGGASPGGDVARTVGRLVGMS